MEQKEFSRTFIASMKRVARNVAPLVREKTKLNKEIAERQARLSDVEEEIAGYEVPIKKVTGGYTTEDLIERVVVSGAHLRQVHFCGISSGLRVVSKKTIDPVSPNLPQTTPRIGL